jgi:hypothetical protein
LESLPVWCIKAPRQFQESWDVHSRHGVLLGEKFDLRQFHRQIIEDGTVPFPALREKLGLK